MINKAKSRKQPDQCPSAHTKTRILDVAERMFATAGVQGVSVRAILSEAGVNLALAHYYFGSRDGLIREVLQRRIDPLNKHRLRLLDEAEASAHSHHPPLHAVLRAFFAPVIELLNERPDFARLLGQLHVAADPKLREFFLTLFGEVIGRFSDAVHRALPLTLPGIQRVSRSHFTIGVMIHTLTSYADMELMAQGRYKTPKGETLLNEMVTFCAAGLMAPVTNPIKKHGKRAQA